MEQLLFLATGPGQKLQEAVSTEIKAIFFLLIVITTVTLFYKKAFTAFIGFALFAMLVSVFIFNPQLVTNLGSNGFSWLFEAYLE
ncbi:hypothetical protein [Risungbinella massiliensis]|uniref:hypothetical protein n=1 Tax=Risungbinella massiliensis TaxID=1329796 RepID=UPI0005CC1ABE|nr:hypothetical protein [Risungbinella massiliensis]